MSQDPHPNPLVKPVCSTITYLYPPYNICNNPLGVRVSSSSCSSLVQCPFITITFILVTTYPASSDSKLSIVSNIITSKRIALSLCPSGHIIHIKSRIVPYVLQVRMGVYIVSPTPATSANIFIS